MRSPRNMHHTGEERVSLCLWGHLGSGEPFSFAQQCSGSHLTVREQVINVTTVCQAPVMASDVMLSTFCVMAHTCPETE